MKVTIDAAGRVVVPTSLWQTLGPKPGLLAVFGHVSGKSVHYDVHYLLDPNGRWIMRQTTFTELRNQARTFFDAVERGEVVRVFRNGKPIADIVPVASESASWKRRVPQPLVIKGVSISAEIINDRAHTRS